MSRIETAGTLHRLAAGEAVDGCCPPTRYVEAHAGRIWIEFEGQGRGSTFCFTLPFA